MKLLVFIICFISSSTFAFTLNNNVDLVFGKNEVTVNVAANSCSHIGMTDTEILTAVQIGVDQYWNKAPTSRLKLRAGTIKSVAAIYKTGTICLPSTSCDPDPTLAVDSDILISCNTNASNFSSTSVLAVTVPNTIDGRTIVGSLVLLNDITPANQMVLKTQDEKIAIIAHELGHAFGLGHSPVKDSLMYYATVNMRKSLGSDDIDGISYLYPKEQPVSCGTITDRNQINQFVFPMIIGIVFIAIMSKARKFILNT